MPASTPFLPDTAQEGVHPNYYSNGWYFASVDGNVNNYTEPSTFPPNDPYHNLYNDPAYASNPRKYWVGNPPHAPQYDSTFLVNLCGPGSATKLITSFKSLPNSYNGPHYVSGYTTPQQGYMLQLALDPGFVMMRVTDPNIPGQWNTMNGDEATVIDSATNFDWYTYGTDYQGDGLSRLNLNQFNTETSLDLQTYGYPMILATPAQNLGDGWTTNPVHLVAINGWNPGANQIYFFDSASTLSAYGVNVAGFHIQNTPTISNANGLYDTVW